jgi:hypothetical protein
MAFGCSVRATSASTAISVTYRDCCWVSELDFPNIENQRERATLLSSIVVLGGLARLYGVWSEGWPAPPMLFALVMELGVVPLLWMWQRQLAVTNLRLQRISTID